MSRQRAARPAPSEGAGKGAGVDIRLKGTPEEVERVAVVLRRALVVERESGNYTNQREAGARRYLVAHVAAEGGGGEAGQGAGLLDLLRGAGVTIEQAGAGGAWSYAFPSRGVPPFGSFPTLLDAARAALKVLVESI